MKKKKVPKNVLCLQWNSTSNNTIIWESPISISFFKYKIETEIKVYWEKNEWKILKNTQVEKQSEDIFKCDRTWSYGNYLLGASVLFPSSQIYLPRIMIFMFYNHNVQGMIILVLYLY